MALVHRCLATCRQASRLLSRAGLSSGASVLNCFCTCVMRTWVLHRRSFCSHEIAEGTWQKKIGHLHLSRRQAGLPCAEWPVLQRQ